METRDIDETNHQRQEEVNYHAIKLSEYLTEIMGATYLRTHSSTM